MAKIRTGVVGVGHLGYIHARIHSALEQTELVGIVDIDPAHRERAESSFDVPAYASVDELLARGVEAVSLAVPTTDHHPLTLKLLEAGVDVLVEKPIAKTIEQAQEMVDVARRERRILQVGHSERFNGAVIAMFEAAGKPEFIECHRLSPYPNRSADVSVVLDLMIHDLDIISELVRSEVVSVDAVGVSVLSAQEDIANVRIRFASGCVANLTSSRISMERKRKIRIFEKDAYISTDYMEQEVLVYRRKKDPVADNTPWTALFDREQLAVNREEPLKLELEAFLESVRTRQQPVVTGEDGLTALKLAQDVIDFMRSNG